MISIWEILLFILSYLSMCYIWVYCGHCYKTRLLYANIGFLYLYFYIEAAFSFFFFLHFEVFHWLDLPETDILTWLFYPLTVSELIIKKKKYIDILMKSEILWEMISFRSPTASQNIQISPFQNNLLGSSYYKLSDSIIYIMYQLKSALYDGCSYWNTPNVLNEYTFIH